MKVTDEMANVAIKEWYKNDSRYDSDAMRSAIEAALQTAWVKFDEYDKESYPPIGSRVLVLTTLGSYQTDFITDDEIEWYSLSRLSYCSHWMPLPEFKEKCS
jgi:hypothetical protein